MWGDFCEPWDVNIHFFDAFPSDVLIKIFPDTCREMFFSSLKEADYIRYGSSRKMMNLTKKDQTQIWNSLLTDNYEQYVEIRQKITDEKVKFIPLKVYALELSTTFQDLFPAFKDAENSQTLESALKIIFDPVGFGFSSSIFLLHGVKIPLNTPLVWLSENMSYSDTFLHLVCAKKMEEDD
jgi:autophagy-related protein 5